MKVEQMKKKDKKKRKHRENLTSEDNSNILTIPLFHMAEPVINGTFCVQIPGLVHKINMMIVSKHFWNISV